jgi:hypothetical protein
MNLLRTKSTSTPRAIRGLVVHPSVIHAPSAGISQQGGRRHLAIASALVRARRAMWPQSTRPRLRAIAQPSTPCSTPTVILHTPVSIAARRPQTHIAFQACREGQPTRTITPALPPLGDSTVILCRTMVRTRRSALVGRSTGSGGSETPTFILYLAITNGSYVLSGAYGGGGGWGGGGRNVVTCRNWCIFSREFAVSCRGTDYRLQ